MSTGRVKETAIEEVMVDLVGSSRKEKSLQPLATSPTMEVRTRRKGIMQRK
ncbi:UNVERIFIED_CONTAM: hypothetical protein Slati_0978900 [Sesamum latifolium]|uniref:Uncharacterized protein n=1 Tax=Sesamum latifolium TaxID=2727402 RepID=A0AAW2XQZ6_9LAMI